HAARRAHPLVAARRRAQAEAAVVLDHLAARAAEVAAAPRGCAIGAGRRAIGARVVAGVGARLAAELAPWFAAVAAPRIVARVEPLEAAAVAALAAAPELAAPELAAATLT